MALAIPGILPDDCWGWDGTINPKTGYAFLYWRDDDGEKHNKLAHRVSFECFEGPIPEGEVVRHTCDTRHCCNPLHLITGTQLQNMQDMHERGRAARPGRIIPASEEADIKHKLSLGIPQRVIAAEHGISQGKVSKINLQAQRSFKDAMDDLTLVR